MVLILPPRVAPIDTSDIDLFVPPETVYPGLHANEQTIIELLAPLNRDETLLVSARLNAIVSALGVFDFVKAQLQGLQFLGVRGEEIDRISQFAKAHSRHFKAHVTDVQPRPPSAFPNPFAMTASASPDCTGIRSSTLQTNFRLQKRWCRKRDSNPRPHHYE